MTEAMKGMIGEEVEQYFFDRVRRSQGIQLIDFGCIRDLKVHHDIIGP
jgi:hypothetical protein